MAAETDLPWQNLPDSTSHFPFKVQKLQKKQLAPQRAEWNQQNAAFLQSEPHKATQEVEVTRQDGLTGAVPAHRR